MSCRTVYSMLAHPFNPTTVRPAPALRASTLSAGVRAIGRLSPILPRIGLIIGELNLIPTHQSGQPDDGRCPCETVKQGPGGVRNAAHVLDDSGFSRGTPCLVPPGEPGVSVTAKCGGVTAGETALSPADALTIARAIDAHPNRLAILAAWLLRALALGSLVGWCSLAAGRGETRVADVGRDGR